MKPEIEAKFTDIDVDTFRAKLGASGATLIHGELSMRRKNFDYPDMRLQKKAGWIRVRDEGTQVTLSYKQLNERTLLGTEEVSCVVDDFDAACEFLSSIGLVQKAHQETRRERWELGGVEVTIDTWPWIPTFVEFEAGTEDALKEAVEKIGFDISKALYGSVENVYQMHYDFTEDEIDSWSEILFVPEPAWLLAKRRQS